MFRKYSALLLTAIVLLAACKKEETETKPSLTSIPGFRVEPYYKNGDVIEVTPSEVKCPNEDVKVSYSWKIASLMDKSDTSSFEDGRFRFTINKDTLGTFSISCTASAEGYYSSSASASFTIVKAGFGTGSIKGILHSLTDSQITDSRSGQENGQEKYYTIKGADGREWFKQNLSYTTSDKKFGIAFSDCENISDVLGRFYNWEEAQTVCPEGWRLPSEEEFRILAEKTSGRSFETTEEWENCSGDFFIYGSFNGDPLLEYWPDVKVTNKSGFCALPFGYCNIPEKKFTGSGKYAAYWTSDSEGEYGVYRYLIDDKPGIYRGTGSKKDFGANVRCIRKAAGE